MSAVRLGAEKTVHELLDDAWAFAAG